MSSVGRAIRTPGRPYKNEKLPRERDRVAVPNFNVTGLLSLAQDVEHKLFDLHVTALGVLPDRLFIVLDEGLL